MTTILNILGAAALVIPFGLVLLNIYSEEKADDQSRQATVLPKPTELIQPTQICMASNIFMGRGQVAVTHSGSTYFACSDHCAKRLRENTNDRYAIDSVTNKQVNKADALISIHPDGSGQLCYFESKENHMAFLRRAANSEKQIQH